MIDAHWCHEPSLLLSNLLVVQLPSLSSLHGPRCLLELQLPCPCSGQQEGRRWKSKKSAIISWPASYICLSPSPTQYSAYVSLDLPSLLSHTKQERLRNVVFFLIGCNMAPNNIYVFATKREEENEYWVESSSLSYSEVVIT